MYVKVKKLNDKAIIPTKGSVDAAGFDLSACIDETVEIKPHETVTIGTGLAVEIPNGYFGGVYARSGLARKCGLRPANAVGVCDSDYRGEYLVALHNDSNNVEYIEPNQRIAQLIIQPYPNVEFIEVSELTETDRGAGGFGSTGK